MRDDQKTELERIQQMAIDHTIKAMDAADSECDIANKEGRGDRVWLTKAANQSMSLACRIEQFFAVRQGVQPDGEKGKPPEQQATEIIKRASKQYQEYKDRTRPS